ncbi:MAG: serine/threonine protein phosphatase, partial [Halioglobus sp.]|nr:serine/threonine protein phosphatase [Halioglobus sp.]
FAIGVGDVWQHQTLEMDADHRARGFETVFNPYFDRELAVTDRVLSEEVPTAVAGYSLLAAAGIPFGVAPGNHDHDAMWSVAEFPPRTDVRPQELRMEPEFLGMLHIGGLDNFRSAFGADSAFFKDRPWYVGHINGGGSSAQTFRAGGYTFLHIALEMQPSDEVVAWALEVIDAHAGMPTMISTHDYLNTQGERLANPIVDLARVDPERHNSAEQLWNKLISQRDEIFLVLCGHQHAQSRRVDSNANGFEVHQVLADYQGRGQSGMDAGEPPDRMRGVPRGIGDGWFRLMSFELGGAQPRIRVRTYSSHYDAYSSELPTYAQWYKPYEQKHMTDEEFLAGDEFVLELKDFRVRFGAPDTLR